MQKIRPPLPVHPIKVLSCFALLLFFIRAPLHAQESLAVPETSRKITKGRSYISLSFSLDQRKAENEAQLFRQVIDQDKLNYRVNANGGYALKDNFTLGLGLSYGREKEDIHFVDENGVEVTSRFLSNDVSFIPHMRNYIPFGNGTFQIFVQTDMRLTFAESLRRDFFPDEIDKTERNAFEYRLGVSPGVLLFFDRHWAFELSVGLAGLTSRITEEVVNDQEADKARIVKTDIDLKINLLALNLGVAYYF